MAVHKINPRLTPRPAPVRAIEIVLDGDYAGWWAKVRTNHTLAVSRAMTGDDNDARFEALKTTIIAWNWVDEDGEPLPQPANGGLDACMAEALNLLIERWVEIQTEAAALPKT